MEPTFYVYVNRECAVIYVAYGYSKQLKKKEDYLYIEYELHYLYVP